MNKKLILTLFTISIVSISIIGSILTPISAAEQQEFNTMLNTKVVSNTCTITFPTEGANVSGTITISVDANRLPTIYVDNTKIGKGYNIEWDTTTVTEGSHTIKAINREARDEIIVNVDNGGGTPGTGDGIVRKWALCIGISDYLGDENDLTYCDEDVVDWVNFFNSRGYNIITLVDSQATYSNILDQLQVIADHEDADDIVAVTYSGHGMYDFFSMQSGWISHDMKFLNEDLVEAITDTYDSTSVFWFDNCCNIGTFENLANIGWVMAQGSTISSYTYDGNAEMQNTVFVYYAMEAIAAGYYTAESISLYAINSFNTLVSGEAYLVDNHKGHFNL